MARTHINHQVATDALMTRAAIASVLDKKGAEYFNKLIGDLSDGE